MNGLGASLTIRCIFVGFVALLSAPAPAQVVDETKISATMGGLVGPLDNFGWFGAATAAIGDLDGNGITDLAVGNYLDDDGGNDRGAIWILFLQSDGQVIAEQKISSTQGNFFGVLDDDDRFGSDIACLGDLDDDGIDDLAVGAVRDDDGGPNRGAVWILFLNANGTVKSHAKISQTSGGFTGTLGDEDRLGWAVAPLSDFDGDGVEDLVVSTPNDDDGFPFNRNFGSFWLLYLNADGSVKEHRKIGRSDGGFAGALDPGDLFGISLSPLGDLDGDGVTDIAVGAERDDDGGSERGAVWIVFLQASGTVKSHQKISSTEGDFGAGLSDDDLFSRSASALPDLDGDGVIDLLVTAYGDDDGGSNRGSVWIVYLETSGVAKSVAKISSLVGGFAGTLDDGDRFGSDVTVLGDLQGDGSIEVAIGARHDDDGGTDRGAVWILSLTHAPPTSIVAAPTTNSLVVSPNPFQVNEPPRVRFVVPEPGALVEIGVFDVAGRRLGQTLLGQHPGGLVDEVLPIDRSRSVAGVLILQVRIGSRTEVMRLVSLP